MQNTYMEMMDGVIARLLYKRMQMGLQFWKVDYQHLHIVGKNTILGVDIVKHIVISSILNGRVRQHIQEIQTALSHI